MSRRPRFNSERPTTVPLKTCVLCDLIREECARQGLPIRALAERAGRNHLTVKRVLYGRGGRRQASLGLLMDLVAALPQPLLLTVTVEGP